MARTYEHLLNAPADEHRRVILEGVANTIEAAFPEKFRSVYVIGSTVDSSATEISDLDGHVYLTDNATNSDITQAKAVLSALQQVSPVRLDISVGTVRKGVFASGSPDVRIKLGGFLVAGEELRGELEMPSLQTYRSWMRRWPDRFIPLMHDGNTEQPVTYPAPEDEFFGYTQIRVPVWYPAGVDQGTKELVAAVCWVASAIIALKTEEYVVTRKQSVDNYQSLIADEWSGLVKTTYEYCKLKWQYRIPRSVEERKALTRICEQFPEFCSHYYTEFGVGDPL